MEVYPILSSVEARFHSNQLKSTPESVEIPADLLKQVGSGVLIPQALQSIERH